MKNILRRGKETLGREGTMQVIEKHAHNKTSIVLQNLVDTEGHDAVGSFDIALSSYRGV